MQKATKISAFFFLGLFCLLMLHQAFPHLHHQHEDSHSHSQADITHSGEHHHHDNNSKEKEKSPYGFFDFFMDMHMHSTVSNDIVVLKRTTVEQQSVADKAVANTAFDSQSFFLLDKGQNESPPIYHPPNIYFNPYLSNLDLRGPPALG